VPDDGSTPKNVHYDRLSTTMDACVVEVENTIGMLVKSGGLVSARICVWLMLILTLYLLPSIRFDIHQVFFLFFFFFLNRFEEIQDAAVSTAVGNLMNSDQEEIHRVLQCGQRLKGKRWCHPYV